MNFQLPVHTEVAPGSLQPVWLVEATPHSLIGELAVGRSLSNPVMPSVSVADELVRIGAGPSQRGEAAAPRPSVPRD